MNNDNDLSIPLNQPLNVSTKIRHTDSFYDVDRIFQVQYLKGLKGKNEGKREKRYIFTDFFLT